MDPVKALTDEELADLEDIFRDLIARFGASPRATRWLARKGLEIVGEQYNRRLTFRILDAQLTNGHDPGAPVEAEDAWLASCRTCGWMTWPCLSALEASQVLSWHVLDPDDPDLLKDGNTR